MSWIWLYFLDCLAICLLGSSYYRNCYRQGYRIDFFHAELCLFCLFPYMLMLPFASNDLNQLVVGRDFLRTVAAVPTAFLITMAGFVSVLIGGGMWNLKMGIGIRRTIAKALDLGPRCSLMVMSSRELLVFLSVVCVFMQSLLLTAYFKQSGFGFDLRAYTFANPGVRPVAQIIALTAIVVASHCLARFAETREKSLLLCTLMLTFGLVFFGQRGNLVAVFFNVSLCYLIKLRDKVSLLKMFALVVAIAALGLYLGNVREGNYSLGEFLSSIFVLAFYGNNFSDLRDFAWIYGDWNHHLWFGRTYLAGLMTFLPRGASGFRALWTFGVATGGTVGLDTELHPGLKPGQFGESYFNFGLLGVVVVGLIFGIIVRRVDSGVKGALSGPTPSMIRAFASTTLVSLAVCFNTSLALPSLYALVGVYALAWLYLRARLLFFPSRRHMFVLGSR